MCRFCVLATQFAGKSYMCRVCWRKQYRNKKG